MKTSKMYHYTESGLDNVWLANGFSMHQTDYGPGVSITNQKGLHTAIAQMLVASSQALSGAEFRFLRKELDLSQTAFGKIVGKTEQAVAKWEKSPAVPKDADLILRAMYREKRSGNAELCKLIEEFNSIDRERLELELALVLKEDQWQERAA